MRFNNIKFNDNDDKNKILYEGVEFKCRSKVTLGLDLVAAFLLEKSNLYANPTKKNITKLIMLQSRFGGKFNNTRFNRGETIKYTSVSVNSSSSLRIFEDNASVNFKIKSGGFKGDPHRIRYPNTNFNSKPMFNRTGFNRNLGFKPRVRGISFMEFNPTIETSAGVNFIARSDLRATLYKYMVGNIEFVSKSLLTLINFRARFVSVIMRSTSRFYADAETVSKEILVLSDLGFKPGDVIVIDLDNFFITHNSIDITYKALGEFFKFYPNVNMVYWQDDVNERTVKKEILSQNKYL